MGEDLPQKTKLGEVGKGFAVVSRVVNQRAFLLGNGFSFRGHVLQAAMLRRFGRQADAPLAADAALGVLWPPQSHRPLSSAPSSHQKP